MTERDFPLADVLSLSTGLLLSTVDGLHALLDHMTGDALMTHQLPRAMDVCGPALIEQHPWLADLKPPDGIDIAELFAWLADVQSRHPAELTVSPIDIWERRNPIEELRDMVGPGKPIIAVEVPRD